MASDHGIGSWIPQLFFDLIGRVLPGFIILITLGVTILDTEEIKSTCASILNGNSTTISLLAGIAISYTIAVACAGFRHIVISILRLLKKLVAHILGRNGHAGHTDDRTERSMKYHFIKITAPATGERIAKLRTEGYMTRVLQAGFLIVAAIAPWYDKTYELFVLLPAIVFMFAVEKATRNERITEIEKCSDLLGYDEHMAELRKADNKKKPTASKSA